MTGRRETPYRVFHSADPPAGSNDRPSVAIVSNEIVGPFKNGGIGTAMTGLAEALAGAGLPVTIVYTGRLWSSEVHLGAWRRWSRMARHRIAELLARGGLPASAIYPPASWSPESELGAWRKRFADIGIQVVELTVDDLQIVDGPMRDLEFGAPFLVYRYLREQSFDIVHFNECLGEGYLCLVAKSLGLAFDDTLLCVALHSPSQWVSEVTGTPPRSTVFAAYNYAERLGIRCADVFWGPSRYLLDWCRRQGFRFPEQTFLQPYVIPSAEPFEPLPRRQPRSRPQRGRRPVREIVFFGRLEGRKGLPTFCNAIDRVEAHLAERGVSLTFLGKPGTCEGMHGLEYVHQRARSWRCKWRTRTSLGRQAAVRYLLEAPAVAVIPSPFDNSPCTLYEALTFGIPFLATRSAGMPELIATKDHPDVLFDPCAEALAEALLRVVNEGAVVAGPAVTQSECRRRWIAMHRDWRALLPGSGSRPRKAPSPSSPPRVIAVVDHGGGRGLGSTLASLGCLESVFHVVVLSRSGPVSGAGHRAASLRIIDLREDDPGELEAEVTGRAGAAVLLLLSGVTVNKDAFATMLQAFARGRVDGLIPAASRASRPEKVVLPLGGGVAFAYFEGVAFTGGLLVKSSVLPFGTRAWPLVADREFLGLADFAVCSGGNVWPYPEPVLEMPPDFAAGRRSSGTERIAAYDSAAPIERYYMDAIEAALPGGSGLREVQG